MRRELHVRFWEGPGVRFPRATRLVVGFQRGDDAARFRQELTLRVRQFGLELHPDKTRLFRFGRFAASDRRERGEGKPETFEFLGFTHICGKSSSGKFLLHRHTSKARMRARLRALKDAIKRRQHLPVHAQGRWLQSVLRGYFAYHAVPTNIDRLGGFRTQVTRYWHKALRRRGQRDRTTWDRMSRLAGRWLPKPRVLHPYPWDRFDVRTRGKSRVR